MADRDYTDEELTKARPLTPGALKSIRDRAGLMRWDDRNPVPGSLADVFWNKDMPRLLREASNQDSNPER